MLKIIKDVAIRHDGREIYCKAGQIVNVKASFDINDDVAKGTEIRYADKLRNNCFRVEPKDQSKTITLKPQPIHNAVEQSRKHDGTDAAIIRDENWMPEPKENENKLMQTIEDLQNEIEALKRINEQKVADENKKGKGGKKS